MQKIELNRPVDSKLFCPFCGTATIGDGINPCKHTLYIATDESWEYVSDVLGLGDEPDIGDDNMDEFTDKIKFPESLKIACYTPAPSFFGVYIGYADNKE